MNLYVRVRHGTSRSANQLVRWMDSAERQRGQIQLLRVLRAWPWLRFEERAC